MESLPPFYYAICISYELSKTMSSFWLTTHESLSLSLALALALALALYIYIYYIYIYI